MGDTGLEKPKKPREKQSKAKLVTPKAPPFGTGMQILWVDLKVAGDIEDISHVWASTPENIRKAILAMLEIDG